MFSNDSKCSLPSSSSSSSSSPVHPRHKSSLVGEFSQRLADIFKRNGTSPWTDKEVAAFKKLHFDSDEVALLERYYASERKKPDNICRRDLQTLLNNYASEIDRARAFCSRQPRLIDVTDD
jgi:hypothetical protein